MAWVSLVPLLFIVKKTSPARAFFFSYITGALFFAGSLYWLTYVTKLGYPVLILYLSLFFGLFGLLSNVFFRKFENSRLSFLLCVIIPALWVSVEFMRGWFFTGFPWGLLGYTQYKNPLLIQIADITGAYGVSFMIVMVNFILFSCLSIFLKKEKKRAFVLQAIIFCIILGLYIGYGAFSLKKIEADTNLRLAVVQGSIEQFKKWDPAYRDYILDRYETLTKEAAEDGVDLVVWPETAIPGFIDEDDIRIRLLKLMKEMDAPLFSGAVTYEGEEGKDYFFNSAILFSPDGTIRRQYDKIHLVPFGEYIPFESEIPFFRNAINKEIGNYTKGEEFTIFEITKENERPYKYAALICFEDIFPELARRFAKDGADFLINITNDAWFRESSEQFQHAQASVFRAVENRTSVIRAANNGLSCYISPKGIIKDSIYDKNTGNIYKEGSKTFNIKVEKNRSFYTSYGDIFICACFAFLILCYFMVCNHKV
ncbi:MAG: apolipoprotein N-acyltransferase [Candidatus Omnitrophota bacterium]